MNDVVLGIGYDKRIGHEFLQARAGLGRQLLPEGHAGADPASPRTPATTSTCCKGVIAVNEEQLDRVVDKIARRGRRLASTARASRCGASRSRPAPTTCASRRRWRSSSACVAEGANVRAYDPTVDAAARRHRGRAPTRTPPATAPPCSPCSPSGTSSAGSTSTRSPTLMAAPRDRRRPQPARPRRAAARPASRYQGIGRIVTGGASSSPAAPASSARTSATRCSTAATRSSPSTTSSPGARPTSSDLFGDPRLHVRRARRQPSYDRGRRAGRRGAALRQPGLAGATTSTIPLADPARSAALGTAQPARAWPRPRAPASSWPRPARCTATRSSTRSPRRYWGNVNPIGPRSVYDEAKRFAEAMTMAYHRTHGVDVRIVRIFNTYGPRMRPGDGRVVSNFLVQALPGEPLTIYGDGTQTRSFCYVDDEVAASWPCSTATLVGPGQHRQPERVHDPRAGQARARGDRLDVRASCTSRCRTTTRRSASPTSPWPATRLGWEPVVALAGRSRADCDAGCDERI